VAIRRRTARAHVIFYSHNDPRLTCGAARGALKGDTESQMSEQRRSPRLRTLKGGSIIFGVAAAIDCIIRNMSVTGAALEVDSPVGIPDEFTLLIKPEFVKRNCRVA